VPVGDAAEIVDPEDVVSIVSGLVSVACDRSLRERLRVAGLKRAKEFNWNQTAAATLGVYQQAAARLTSARGQSTFNTHWELNVES
jgi:hypothetical protein